MTPERIQEIYDLLAEHHVDLADDPTLRGPGYIPKMIQTVLQKSQSLAQLKAEIERAFGQSRNQVRLLKHGIKQRTELFMRTSPIADMEVSVIEKRIHAEAAMEEQYREAVVKDATDLHAADPVNNPPPPLLENVKGLQQELTDWENIEEDLRALRSSVEEAIKHIKSVDSGVRLQNQAMDVEARMYAGLPAINGTRTGHHRPPERKSIVPGREPARASYDPPEGVSPDFPVVNPTETPNGDLSFDALIGDDAPNLPPQSDP